MYTCKDIFSLLILIYPPEKIPSALFLLLEWTMTNIILHLMMKRTQFGTSSPDIFTLRKKNLGERLMM